MIKDERPILSPNAADEWRQRMTLWNRERAGEQTPLDSQAFWNSFSLWEEYEKYANYPGPLLSSITASVDSHTTILDVGAGTGSLSSPLARIARLVTAVEPSAAQVERLKKRLGKEQSEKVRIIQKNWEEVALSELGLHDITIAGYSLFMPDIVPALRKIIERTTRRVFIVHLYRHDLQSALRKIKGDEILPPDTSLLIRVLQEMGREVSLTVHKRDFQLPLELQLHMFRYAQRFSDEQIGAVEEYLRSQGRLFSQQGSLWLRRRYRDAVLSIDVNQSRIKRRLW